MNDSSPSPGSPADAGGFDVAAPDVNPFPSPNDSSTPTDAGIDAPAQDASTDAAPVSDAQTGAPLWFRTAVPDDAGSFSSADFVAADTAGNVYLSVRHQGPVDFGQGPVPGSGSSGALMILKYDPSGTLAWATPFPAVLNVGDLQTLGMGADSQGGVALVVENGQATANFGTDAGAIAGKEFVVKLDASGKPAWIKSYAGKFVGNGQTGQYSVQDVAVSPAGDVAFGGYIYQAIDFGNGTITPTGAQDGFVVALDPSSNLRFVKHWGVAGKNMMVNGVAFTSSGGVALAGNLDAVAFDLGGGSLPAIGKADLYGNADGFALLLDTNGNYVHAKRFGGAGATTTGEVITQAGTGFAIAGTFNGTTLDWGGGATLTAGDAGAGLFLYAAMLDANVTHVWSHAYGTPSDNVLQVGGIGVSASGNPVLSGSFANAIDFGDHAISVAGDDGISKAFVTELAASDGHAVFSRASNAGAPATGTTYCPALAVGGDGIYAAGFRKGVVDWGGMPEPAVANATYYVVKLAQ